MSDAVFVELPRVRLDGGVRAARQWLGPPCLPEEPEDDDTNAEDTISLKESASSIIRSGSPLGKNFF